MKNPDDRSRIVPNSVKNGDAIPIHSGSIEITIPLTVPIIPIR